MYVSLRNKKIRKIPLNYLCYLTPSYLEYRAQFYEDGAILKGKNLLHKS